MANYKIVVFVPLDHADKVREAIGEAGGGKLGNYSFCSFSTRGIGRFKPDEGAKPHVGTVGKFEQVEEEKIEITCDGKVMDDVVAAIKRVHPYEEIAMDIWPLSTDW
jgi:hypothetical protein